MIKKKNRHKNVISYRDYKIKGMKWSNKQQHTPFENGKKSL